MPAAEILFDPFLPEVIANPYPFYRRLRAEDPVHETYIAGHETTVNLIGNGLLALRGLTVLPVTF